MELLPYLFSIEGVKVFFSKCLCQDPLEKFFGCQRQCGHTNENPTVQEFYKNTQALTDSVLQELQETVVEHIMLILLWLTVKIRQENDPKKL